MRVWPALSLLPFHFIPKEIGSTGAFGLATPVSAAGTAGTSEGNRAEGGTVVRRAAMAALTRCAVACFAGFVGELAADGVSSGPKSPCAVAAEVAVSTITTRGIARTKAMFDRVMFAPLAAAE